MERSKLEETVDDIIDVSMSRLKEIVDVNTVVGKPLKIDNNTTVLPVSKVQLGFVAGGGEVNTRLKNRQSKQPFAGGSGSGFVVTPIGFLTIQNDIVKYVSCEDNSPINEIINLSKSLVNKVMDDKKDGKNENKI